MDLLIVGASARAAAFSAARLGLRPTCVNLFADLDLEAVATTHRVEPESYPDGLAEVAATLPPMPWLYTGAIENRPDLVDRISVRHRLLGNAGNPLRAVRNPLALAEAFRDSGLRAPGVRLDPAGLPDDGSWLRKPIASAGGHGIRPWLGQPSRSRRPSYYQERIEGLPISAIFVGSDLQSRCLGITRQFVGKAGNRFAYRGSLAPYPVDPQTRDRIDEIGRVIVGWFGLSGLFGVDLILRGDDPWPVEVNPRFTASVEVLEWSLGRSLLAEHLRACGFDHPLTDLERVPLSFVAKTILFAKRKMTWVPGRGSEASPILGLTEIADIPRPGSTFEPGDPVLTVFATGSTSSQCRKKLVASKRAWQGRLGPD